MIRWRRPLYIDESIKESPAGIRYRFKFKKYPGDYYFIILPAGRDMPEIIRCIYLKQSWYKSVDYDILGVASEKIKPLNCLKKWPQMPIRLPGCEYPKICGYESEKSFLKGYMEGAQE